MPSLKLPSVSEAQRPYQVGICGMHDPTAYVLQIQTLADLRAGSLPPESDEKREPESTKKRRRAEDTGTRTEPESATEDTTDYSSSGENF